MKLHLTIKGKTYALDSIDLVGRVVRDALGLKSCVIEMESDLMSGTVEVGGKSCGRFTIERSL